MGQTLYALALSIETASTTLDGAVDGTRTPLSEAAVLSRRAMSEVRRAIWGLSFPELRAQGFVPSLRALASAAERETGIAVAVEAGRLPRIGMKSQDALFRAAREALINAIRHARARRVTIELNAHHGQVLLEVTDDGVGLGGVDWRDVAGFGLRALAAAIDEVGGELELVPGDEGGLRLRVRVSVRTG